MIYLTVIAQATPPAADPGLNVSKTMGRVVGILVIAIILIWIVQKFRGKK